MDTKIISSAYRYWYRYYGFEYGNDPADREVGLYLDENMKAYNTGWVKRARHALFLSTGIVACRLGISRSTYVRLERNEELGVIQMMTLKKLAEAMDCELVYAIRPRQRLCYSEVIWRKLLPVAIDHWWVRSRSLLFKDRALAAVAKWKMEESEFRRQQCWSER